MACTRTTSQQGDRGRGPGGSSLDGQPEADAGAGMVPGAEPQEANAILAELLSNADADPTAELYLWRIEPRTKHANGPAYLERFYGQAPTLDDIRDTYGGGTYRIILKRGSPKLFKGSAVFAIAGQPIFPANVVPADGSPRPLNGSGMDAPISGDGELSALRREVQRLAQLVAGGASHSADDEDARERREFRRMMREHMVLRAFSEQPAGSDPLAMVERLMDVYDRVRQDTADDKGPDWQSSLAQVALNVLATPRVSLAAPPAKNPTPAPAPTGEERQTAMMRRILRGAQAGEDPGALATWAWSLLPDSFKAQIPALDNARWLALWAQLPPGAPFPEFSDPDVQEWLSRFRIELVALSPDAPRVDRTPRQSPPEEAPELPEAEEA